MVPLYFDTNWTFVLGDLSNCYKVGLPFANWGDLNGSGIELAFGLFCSGPINTSKLIDTSTCFWTGSRHKAHFPLKITEYFCSFTLSQHVPMPLLAQRIPNPVEQAVPSLSRKGNKKYLKQKTKPVEIKTWWLVLIKYQAHRTRYRRLCY